MLIRLIIFKAVLLFLVAGSAFGLAIRDAVQKSLSGDSHKPTVTARIFRRYPLPLGGACAAVAFLAAFGDMLVVRRSKSALPTYTDEEFLARFAGNSDAQQPCREP